jgi:threonylcarbamoyladenosine tRNA methylthiotransferase MtaB
MSSSDKKDFCVPRPEPHVPELPTVALATLGCKTNQFESAAMLETLQMAGYRIVPFDEGADLVVVNTCTVTSATDAQSRNLIRRARRLNCACRVIVTGCYAQVDPDTLLDLPGVCLVAGNEEKRRLLDLLGQNDETPRVAVSDIRKTEGLDCLHPLTSFAGRSRAFVQIQNGCNAFCNYCIIPYARGASRSADPEEVITRVAALVDANYQEIVLTGIHIGGYGADLAFPLTLNELVCRIERETGVHRLRLGSIEPTELTDDLLVTSAASKIICPHLHIPLQAGNDRTLQRMGRTYDTQFFARLIDKIRTLLPTAAVCLDVITGFPGETDREFVATLDFLSSLPITDLHVFPYSRRPGTPAAKLPGQIPGNIKRERAGSLRQLAAEKFQAFAESFIGQELEVVVEAGSRDGLFKGMTRNYLDIRFPGSSSLTGQCITVKPTAWQNGVLLGEVVP